MIIHKRSQLDLDSILYERQEPKEAHPTSSDSTDQMKFKMESLPVVVKRGK